MAFACRHPIGFVRRAYVEGQESWAQMVVDAAQLAPTRIRATWSRRVGRVGISSEGRWLATPAARRIPPGFLHADTARSVLVISDDGELAVALRERVEPSRALIRDARRTETEEAVRACVPFPWMVVGEGQPPASIVAAAATRPMLVLWRAPLPREIAAHAVAFTRFAELCAEVERALESEVHGMRLAIGEGVIMPDGIRVSSAHLQALLTAHPSSVRLSARASRSVAALLVRHDAQAALVRDRAGMVVLR